MYALLLIHAGALIRFINLKLLSFKKYCLNAILLEEKIASFGIYNHAVQSVSTNFEILCVRARVVRVRVCTYIHRVSKMF